ncbi:MAG: 4Fe-4S binding protein [Actinomycetia bacterium]|nr:4Fe-4S binding protein [Actinomycetes bacterium]
MSVQIDVEACTGCENCVEECPLELLKVVDGKVGLADPDECTECGSCVDVCGSGALSL